MLSKEEKPALLDICVDGMWVTFFESSGQGKSRRAVPDDDEIKNVVLRERVIWGDHVWEGIRQKFLLLL